MASVICSKCGATLPAGTLVCEVCGNSLASEYIVCPDCGAYVKKGALFCADCGAKINDAPVGDFSFIEAAKAAVSQPIPSAPASESAPVPEAPVSAPVPEPAPAAAPTTEAAAAPVQDVGTPAVPIQHTAPATAQKAVDGTATGSIPNLGTGTVPTYSAPHRRTPPQPQPQLSYPPASFSRNAQPPKGSRYAPVSTWGYVGIILLFAIPVIGWIFCLVWACGGCTKINKRNLARAYILAFVLLVLVLAVTAALLYFFAYSWVEQHLPVLANLNIF